MKKCTRCLTEFDKSMFYKNNRAKDGLTCWCKECYAEYDRSDAGIAKNKRWRNSESGKAYKYDYSKQWRKTPKGRISDLKRRANKNKVWHDFTPEEWDAKLQKTKGICPMCKQYIGIDRLTLYHIIPISRAPIGAVYTIDDIQPLCMKCNVGKSDKVSGKVLLRSEPKRLRRKLRNNYKMEVSIVKHSKNLYGKIIELMEDKTPKFTEDEIIFLNSLK